MSVKELTGALDRVDWNFPRAATSAKTVHALHWFPGNFIPEIPRYFIQLLSSPGDIVLDSFCGSGTTGIEALYLGRNAIMSDANTASLQVAVGKLSAIQQTPSLEYERLIRELTWDALAVSDDYGLNGEGSSVTLRQWINEGTLRQLRFLWKLVEHHERGRPMRAVLEMLFTDTLFRCAGVSGAVTRTGLARRHHWGWIADNVIPTSPASQNAIGIFRAALANAATIQKLTDSKPTALVVRQDARQLAIAARSVDLIVTSPPYAGVIDYSLANRLTYEWMNWPLAVDRALEIGQRRRRAARGFVSEYLSDMTCSVDELYSAMKPRAHCAIVIGASRRHAGAAGDVLTLFEQRLTRVWGPRQRRPAQRRVSERSGRPASELMCVFQKS